MVEPDRERSAASAASAADDSEILSQVSAYYGSKLKLHGASPRGVDWNSAESQALRFSQLAKLLPEHEPFSILDFGCGYGALADYLESTGRRCTYIGYDVNESMILTARDLHRGAGHAFTSLAEELAAADFVLASGIFNVRLRTPRDRWATYVLDTLHTISVLSQRGFAFNMLTKYSDAHRMRDDLYYADPCEMLDYCVCKFSRHVALLHDYALYEFTVIVRKSLDQ